MDTNITDLVKLSLYPQLGYQYALYYILLSLYSRLRVMLYVQKRKRLQVNMNNQIMISCLNYKTPSKFYIPLLIPYQFIFQVAEKFREHLDKVQETIQEALAALPDLSNTDQQSDNKLLIPMIVDNDVSKGSNQVEMTLVNQHSLTNDSRVNMTKKTSMSEQERSSAIDNLDSIVCQLIDENMDQVDETDVAEDISEPKPS